MWAEVVEMGSKLQRLFHVSVGQASRHAEQDIQKQITFVLDLERSKIVQDAGSKAANSISDRR